MAAAMKWDNADGPLFLSRENKRASRQDIFAPKTKNKKRKEKRMERLVRRGTWRWSWICAVIWCLVARAPAAPASVRCPREHTTVPAQRAAGERLLQEGAAAVAAACFRDVLESIGMSDPQTRGEVGVLLADALEAGGDVAGSAAQLKKVQAEFPMSPVPPFKLGNQARLAERWEEAVANYETAVRLAPSFVNARTNLGMSLRGLNRLDDAIAAYRGALTVAPTRADVQINLGVALDAAGKPEESLIAYKAGIRLDPVLYQGYFNMGVLMAETFKDREAGIQLYHEALRIEPNFADAYHTLGTVHTNLGKYDEARRFLERAVEMRPDDSRFHNSLGILYDSIGDNAKALKYYQSSITKAPNSAAAIINAAKVMNSQGRFQEAENMCLEAIRVDPTYGEAYCQLGDVYKDSENIGLALQSYLEGIALAPAYDAGFCNFFYTATFACHWEGRGQHVKKLREVMRKYLRGPDPLTHECVQPFQSLAYPLEPEELLEIARFHARKARVHIEGLVGRDFSPFAHPLSLLTVSSARGGATHHRLRIGFVSADYKDHPVVKDLIHMFSSFDRSKFDIFCFALNPAGPGVGWEESGWHEDGGPGPHRLWRNRAAAHCNLVDVSGDRDADAAALVNDRRMHILFNIMGYTQGERNEIFALEPAPLQVLYKGFVGTLGADYISHMVSDARVSPPEFAQHYTERLIYMPHTYVVNDYRQQAQEFRAAPGDAPIERDLYGLPPEASVIFCNFNQQYKVDAPTLKAWVQILMAVEGSVLWLLRFGTSNAAEVTLLREAQKMGLDDPARIVFTDPVARRIHLQVKALADVFVDTPQYNGHGTATDALWAGIPLVTFPVRKMASRAATSFVFASAGQGRVTIVRTMKDLVNVSVRLGRQRQLLTRLRRDLVAGRFESPMFDTKRWVESFQKTLRMLWETHVHRPRESASASRGGAVQYGSAEHALDVEQRRGRPEAVRSHLVVADLVPPS